MIYLNLYIHNTNQPNVVYILYIYILNKNYTNPIESEQKKLLPIRLPPAYAMAHAPVDSENIPMVGSDVPLWKTRLAGK